MSEDTAPPALTLDAEQTASLQEQCAKFEPNEPYFVALTPDRRVHVRSLKELPQAVIRLWQKHPAMAVPDSAGYRPEIRHISIKEL